MEDLLKKIHALHTHNKEIIARIQSPRQVVLGYRYIVFLESPPNKFGVRVEAEKFSSEALTSSWKPSLEMTLIRDLFNDKIDYGVKGFSDLIRLNDVMLFVADKYSLLREEPACLELRKFLDNFEKVQVGLGSLESSLLDCVSKEADVRQGVDQLNTKIAAVESEAHHRVQFTSSPHGERLSVANCGAVISKDGTELSTSKSSTTATCLGERAIASGGASWGLRIISMNTAGIGDWTFFGVINAAQELAPALYATGTSYGWATWTGDTYLAGVKSGSGGGHLHLAPNNCVELRLNMAAPAPTLALFRNGVRHGELSLPAGGGPWRLQLALYNPTTTLALESFSCTP